MKQASFDEMIARATEYAQFIVEHDATVRDCARVYRTNKSTISFTIHRYLKLSNPDLYDTYCKVAQDHFKYKYMKGGLSTKRKWTENKSST